MPFDWNKTKRTIEPTGYKRYYVWAICPECNQGRWVGKTWAKSGSVYNGMCNKCTHMKGLIKGKFKTGISQDNYGYIMRHRDTFTDEEKSILSGMFKAGTKAKNGYGYVKEHRAVMAIHLGRRLESREIVHHLNGNKSDNRIENLRLLAVKQHHHGHGDDYYQKWQEALIEIERLKSLIVAHGSKPSTE